MRKIISKETIQSFIKEMSLATFYENVAKEFGVNTPDKYDCTKISVAVNIYDQWYAQWKEEVNVSNYELSVHLLMCGPKVDSNLCENEVEILPGFYEEKTSVLGVDAYQIDTNLFEVRLINGKSIRIERQAKYGNDIYYCKIDSQYFTSFHPARTYLHQLILEKISCYRMIYHRKQTVPEICGVNGSACRAKGECNRALCTNCPVAEEFFAEKDGVKLMYVTK